LGQNRLDEVLRIMRLLKYRNLLAQSGGAGLLAFEGRGGDGDRIKADARALEKAGVFAIVLELVPEELAAEIAAELSIPIIGIGAGKMVDAQVLVWTDLMGLTEGAPKFAKSYLDGRKLMIAAATQWVSDVKEGDFPGPDQTFH